MPRTPGPIPVSPGLARVFARCRALRVRAEAEGASDVAALASLHTPCALDLAEVSVAERRLGVALPDDVLAVLATRIPVLELASGFALAAMPDVALRAADDVDDAWIALGEIGELPLDPHADDAPTHYVCVPRESAAGEARVALWTVAAGPRGRGTPRTLGTLLDAQLDIAFGDWAIWRDVLAQADAQPVDPFAQPVLVGEAVAPERGDARRVRHKVFGEGTVVRATLDGKLEIEFDGAGRKTVLASFVTDVDPRDAA